MKKIYHTEEERREAYRAYDRSRTVSYERPECRPNPRNMPRPATREGYRLCNGCGEKPLSEFRYRNGKPLAICMECERARDRERNRLRRPRRTPEKPKATKPGHKVCNTCLNEKPYADFAHDSGQKDGYAGRCSQCKSERYQADEEAKVAKKAYNTAYRQAHHEALLAYDRIRHNTDEDRARRRERESLKKAIDASYREAVRQANLKWRQSHPFAVREYNRRAKVHRKEAMASTRVYYWHILARDGYHCYICECDIDPTMDCGDGQLHFDHVVPLHPRSGEPQGTHTEDNIKPTHKVCNLRKSNRRFEDLTALDKRGIVY